MSKLPDIGTSIFTVMSKLATEHNAINLAQGFPNFPIDERLSSIVSKLATKDVHQYASMAGYPPLLEKITTLTKNSYQRSINPNEEILITAGATQGIFATIQALVKKNEEVVILDPSYDCYVTPVLLCNAKPVHVSLKSDFTPDWETIKKATNSKTKIIIINNPHNPTGKIWNDSDFIELEQLLEDYPKLIILSDEVYEYITFEKKHISIHQRPKLWDRSISVSSFGKSFHVTGWKIGYVIAPEKIMKEIKKVHQFLVFTVNSISQVAISEYLDIVNISELGNFYQQKRDIFRNLLKNTKFKLLPCEGTYFQTVSYEAISGENDIDFTKRILTEIGVATIPVSSFYADKKDIKCIRLCFAKDEETLIRATEKLQLL